MRIRIAVITLLAALGIIVPASSASAHAYLVSSTPAVGSVVASAPATITLTFNEPVTTAPDQVTLLDADGTRTPSTLAPGPPTRITVVPGTPLGPGTWAVSWTVVSADGHIVNGLTPFSVQAPTAEATASAPATADPVGPVDPVDRTLEVASWLAGIAGGALIAGARRRRPLLVAGGIALAAAGMRLVLDVHTSGTLAWQAGETHATVLMLASAAAVIAGALARARQAPLVLGIVGVTALALQGTQSGHHLTLDVPWLAGLHALHLAAAAIWVGSIWALALAPDTRQAARTRRLATASVIVLLASAGTLAASMLTLTAGHGLNPAWVTALAVKTALVAGALGLGLANHRALAPRRREATLASPRRLHRFLVLELAIIALVAVATAVLGVTSPASAPTPTAPAATTAKPPASVAATFAPVSAPLAFDSGPTAALTITPHGTTATVTITGTGDAEELRLTATHAGSTATSGETTLTGKNGTWTADIPLPLPGTWHINAQLQIDAFVATTADTDITLASATPTSAPADPAPSERTPS